MQDDMITNTFKLKVKSFNTSYCGNSATVQFVPEDADWKRNIKYYTGLASNGTAVATMTNSVVLKLKAAREKEGSVPSGNSIPRPHICTVPKVLLGDDYCTISAKTGSKSNAADVLGKIGSVFPGPGKFIGKGFEYLGKFLHLFDPKGTKVKSMDIWNCIKDYVAQYVTAVIDQLKVDLISQEVKGVMDEVAEVDSWVTPEERRSKFGAMLDDMVRIGAKLFDTNAPAPVQVFPQLVQFGSVFVSTRAEEMNNYAFIYGSNLTEDGKHIKFDKTLETIETYKKYVGDAFSSAWNWRSDPSQRGTSYQSGSCPGTLLGVCTTWKAWDTRTGWSLEIKLNTQGGSQRYYSLSTTDMQRWLDAESSQSMVTWWISMRQTASQSTPWPLVIPNKALQAVNVTQFNETYPMGGCGNKNWGPACTKPNGGLIRTSRPYGNDVATLNLWTYDSFLTAAEMVYRTDGGTLQSSGVQGITTNCVKHSLSLAPGELIVKLEVWCYIGAQMSHNGACTEVQGVRVTTTTGQQLAVGTLSSDQSLTMDLSNAPGKVWACALNGRLADLYSNPGRLTALGFDWCWEEVQLQCSSSNPDDCDWKKYNGIPDA